jgi:DNA-3-methyladenine glycosylase
MEKLKREFYGRDTLEVAESLIGKVLVRKYEGNIIKSRIIEAEAYIGAIDKASHCYRGQTERNKVMFGLPGHTYVYLIYGMYYCLNVVTENVGSGSGILLRSVEPLENAELMSLNRYNKSVKDITRQQLRNLSNGPGKICMALKITRNENGIDLTKNEIYIEDDGFLSYKVERSKRINIDYAEEAKEFLWRFTLMSDML